MSNDGAAKLWTSAESALIRTLAEHDGNVTRAAFSPDGVVAATINSTGKVFLWQTATGNQFAP